MCQSSELQSIPMDVMRKASTRLVYTAARISRLRYYFRDSVVGDIIILGDSW